jgi:hypothetical protein
MANPVRYTSGVSTAVKGSALWNYPAPDPTKAHSYFNDFFTYVAADWTVTSVGTTPTRALAADEPFGALLCTISSADNDSTQLQLTTSNFSLAAGKKAWFKTRLKVSDATQSDFLVGLAILDTTLQGSTDGAGCTDGIFFNKDDGDALIDFQVQKNATTGQNRSVGVATCADNTYVTLGWYFDGASSCTCYVDDVAKATIDASSAYLPDTVITPSVAMQNGEAVAKTMTIDYIFAAIER